jgi:hypothetical protein
MPDSNKNNLLYFEGTSMKRLFECIWSWQESSQTRLLSASIHKDRGKFCCIALTNPTEVVICSGIGYTDNVARVSNGELHVRT